MRPLGRVIIEGTAPDIYILSIATNNDHSLLFGNSHVTNPGVFGRVFDDLETVPSCRIPHTRDVVAIGHDLIAQFANSNAEDVGVGKRYASLFFKGQRVADDYLAASYVLSADEFHNLTGRVDDGPCTKPFRQREAGKAVVPTGAGGAGDVEGPAFLTAKLGVHHGILGAEGRYPLVD